MDEPDTVEYFHARLKSLDCPYLEGEESWWIREILFSPNCKQRINLLHWLLQKIEPQQDFIHNCDDLKTEIHKILVSCGVCCKEDMGFVSGSANTSRQAATWRLLLDAAGSPKMSRMSQVSRDMFLDTLASSAHIHEVLAPRINLITPDLHRDINCRSSAPPELNELQELLRLTEVTLKQLQDRLLQLQQQCEPHRGVCDGAGDSDEGLRRVSSDIARLSAEFCHLHDDVLLPWISRQKRGDQLSSSLGPQSSVVFHKLTKITELLDCMKVNQDSYVGLQNVAASTLQSSTTSKQSSRLLLHVKNNIREICSLLDPKPLIKQEVPKSVVKQEPEPFVKQEN